MNTIINFGSSSYPFAYRHFPSKGKDEGIKIQQNSLFRKKLIRTFSPLEGRCREAEGSMIIELTNQEFNTKI